MIIRKDDKRLQDILKRGEIMEGEYLHTVLDIIADVRTRGDESLAELTLRFDGYDMLKGGIEISKREMKDAWEALDDRLKLALENAKANVISFHEKQLENTWIYEKTPGTFLGQKVTALESVGVYVPGGKAVYPSSVLMNVLPAKVAGVEEIVMVTPATGGKVNPVVLAAAYLAGVDRGFRIGGAQAIAALAYGTASVPRVNKIVGPGNIYVALAKKMVFGQVDIDMIAGPSEILIVADSSADPDHVAADMLSQAEHDELASAIVVTDDLELAKEIESSVYAQLEELPKREIAKKSIEKYGAIIVTDDLNEAADITNNIAVEHLELCVANPMEYMLKIRNAGAIFLGANSPEPVGDYYAGPNHVLPTGGTAKFFSPLGTYDFQKKSSIIYYSREQLIADMPDIRVLAESEELIAHRNSVIIRTED
ncbi:histidinol dehydrogenase [Denitrovibrio acetiphilus DSM 12809]|uniref:Histidinol dehydrogenase n=1 Tax=Denitrovibrio acetiphilus (strain DSM 12809 / NBRC 114555 / N2460) TaxID=522772 RepID=D4H3C4_DENA2|nr:histidinol dehydrogenase [Denitrovibrio acetiphilus]ADD67208.1 histidinol dehydrogenase [Denitrovibrio acetiphilus DSM 12809]